MFICGEKNISGYEKQRFPVTHTTNHYHSFFKILIKSDEGL